MSVLLSPWIQAGNTLCDVIFHIGKGNDECGGGGGVYCKSDGKLRGKLYLSWILYLKIYTFSLIMI